MQISSRFHSLYCRSFGSVFVTLVFCHWRRPHLLCHLSFWCVLSSFVWFSWFIVFCEHCRSIIYGLTYCQFHQLQSTTLNFTAFFCCSFLPLLIGFSLKIDWNIASNTACLPAWLYYLLRWNTVCLFFLNAVVRQSFERKKSNLYLFSFSFLVRFTRVVHALHCK